MGQGVFLVCIFTWADFLEIPILITKVTYEARILPMDCNLSSNDDGLRNLNCFNVLLGFESLSSDNCILKKSIMYT